MNRRRTTIAAAVLILALAATLYAQRMTESVQVTVIEVPVTVVDRDGNSVRGLTAENFEVSDDGKRVPIEYFEVIDLTKVSAQEREEAGTPLPPAATRHFLLMFDLANSTPGTIKRSTDAVKQFIDAQLGERDLAAVATFSVEQGARMITNFTRNRALLVNAIETLGNPKFFKVGDPLMLSAQRYTAELQGPKSGEGAFGAGDEAQLEITDEGNKNREGVHDNELRNRLRVQLANMGGVARALDRLRGQKQIILLSEGFNAKLVQGRGAEDLSQQTAKTESEAGITGEVWNVNMDDKFGNTAASAEVNQMVELFRRSDVTLHAIDIKGLRGTTDVGGQSSAGKKTVESLYLLTRPTGGTVFKNANDMTENFAKLLKQQEVVYVLGFKARTTDKPGKFHQLKVKTTGSAPRGARVSHRAGYYEPAKITDLERALSIGEMLMMDVPIDDVQVRTTATSLPGPQGKARVPVVVEIPGPKLISALPGTAATIELYVYAFDKDSQVVDYLQQRISFDTAKAGDAIAKGGVRWLGTLRLPPGQYSVKVAARVEESGLVGVDRKDLTVPAFDRAEIMPPVFFADPGGWAMVLGQTRGDDYVYPFAAGQSKYIPQRNPQIAASGDYKVALFLYKVTPDNLSVTPTIVSADGKSHPAEVKLLGKTAPDAQGLVKLLFAFKPTTIAAGSHELRFDVKAQDGTASVVSLPFTVQ